MTRDEAIQSALARAQSAYQLNGYYDTMNRQEKAKVVSWIAGWAATVYERVNNAEIHTDDLMVPVAAAIEDANGKLVVRPGLRRHVRDIVEEKGSVHAVEAYYAFRRLSEYNHNPVSVGEIKVVLDEYVERGVMERQHGVESMEYRDGRTPYKMKLSKELQDALDRCTLPT